MPTTRTKVCQECGEEFTYIKAGRGTDRRYCDRVCRSATTARKLKELRDSLPKCQVDDCETSIRSSGATWCEMHYGRMRRSNTLERSVRAPTGKCYHCNGPAPKKRIYCSPVCSTRERIGAEYTGRNCIVCDAEIEHQSRWGKIYCGTDCHNVSVAARRYGLTVSEWRDMVAAQGGVCAICRSTEDRLVIDHCHETNKVRALLCGTCNAGIGMLKDSPANLRAAADYLEKHALGNQQSQEEAAA